MCMNFLKHIFGKKDEVITEEQISSGMVINEETVPEENHMPEPNEEEKPQTPDFETVSPVPASAETKLVVLLDNGHAKSTPGKRSPKLDDGRQFFEYEFNRDVVSRIAKGLDKLGVPYHILVPEVEEDIALPERANRANAYCKKYGKSKCFFISVHSNAFGKGGKWEDPGKWSVWTTVGVTKSDEYGKVMYEVAEEMLKPYGFGCRDGVVQGNGNAGPDYEENFTVIYKTWCPAILTENLFFTNKKECEWLMTDEGRQVIADIHVEGIRRIVESL